MESVVLPGALSVSVAVLLVDERSGDVQGSFLSRGRE